MSTTLERLKNNHYRLFIQVTEGLSDAEQQNALDLLPPLDFRRPFDCDLRTHESATLSISRLLAACNFLEQLADTRMKALSCLLHPEFIAPSDSNKVDIETIMNPPRGQQHSNNEETVLPVKRVDRRKKLYALRNGPTKKQLREGQQQACKAAGIQYIAPKKERTWVKSTM